jgi:hypothetical protein
MKTLFATILMASSLALRADPPSTHGMLLFGDKVNFASHLPMFHSPHDYQLLMRLEFGTLPKEMPHTLENYAAAKAAGRTLFTLVPERMDLSQVISGLKRSFRAEIFDGHFERGGKSLGPVSVVVAEIVFAEKLSPRGQQPSHESYLSFGAQGEFFAAHLIEARPSFDAILKIGQPNGSGLLRVARPGSEFVLPEKGDLLGDPLGTQSRVEDVIYLEEAELAH